MRVTPTHYKIAASITVLLIAAPLAYRMAGPRGERTESSPPLELPVTAMREKQPEAAKRTTTGKPIQDRFDLSASNSNDPTDTSNASVPASTGLELRINRAMQDAQGPAVASRENKSVDAAEPQPVRTVRVNPDGSVGGTPAAPSGVTPASSVTAAPLPAQAEKHTQRLALSQQPSASTPAASKDERRLAETEGSDVAGVPVVPEYDDNTNKFDAPTPNPIKRAAAESVSTFSVDVDTASYAYTRRALNSGHLPPKDSVRVEEMINYFPYDYPRPEKAETPFQPTVTVAPAPWNSAHKLMHIGIKGYNITATTRPRANLVFLIDVSGSMSSDDRLPLVKNAFRMLLDELQPDDTVAIVTYASGSGVALEPTRIRNKAKILEAIDRLGAGGSTSGARGIQDAYTLAEATFDKAAVNRIILATDGDFNVGITNPEELKGYVERKRQSGIFLSILGVGEGNYNDALMQKLAQNGNGTAAYVDTLNEARKVLVDEASSTLFTIAKDVKIQVEFNPAQVSEYRLIGYETRALKREDFNNDKVDAGDIGSGHTVTAIYEITPAGAPTSVDELRYQKPDAKPAATGQASEYAFLKIRYKLPNEDTSKLITQAIDREMEKPSIDAAPEDVRFSVAVAAFGQLIRDLPYLQNYRYDDVIALAQGARGPDNFGYRAEFVNLVRLAKSARQ